MEHESITKTSTGIVILTAILCAVFVLAACTHAHPPSPVVEFDYEKCTKDTEKIVDCEVTIHE